MRLRQILGVVDGQQRASRKRSGKIHGARFGLGRANWRNQNLVRRAGRMAAQGCFGGLVVSLDNKDYIEFRSRIVRYYGANATSNLTGYILLFKA